MHVIKKEIKKCARPACDEYLIPFIQARYSRHISESVQDHQTFVTNDYHRVSDSDSKLIFNTYSPISSCINKTFRNLDFAVKISDSSRSILICFRSIEINLANINEPRPTTPATKSKMWKMVGMEKPTVVFFINERHTNTGIIGTTLPVVKYTYTEYAKNATTGSLKKK